MRRRIARALAELGAAAPLGAVCLLAANDHTLKLLFHNALTGKLSDVAICFLLPLLVSAALGLVRDWPGRRRLAVGAVVATLVFTLLELSDAAGALFVRATGGLGLGGGGLTRDPTDLLALACVPLAVAYGRRRLAAAERGPSVWRSATGALVMATGALALMADSYAGGCRAWSAPAVFQAEAGCGPGGQIVVEPIDTDGRFSGIRISNAAALGLPPFNSAPGTGRSTGAYVGNGCPLTLDEGGWEVFVEGCPSPDGGVDGGATGGACGAARVQTCQAALAGGVLSFTCGTGNSSAPTCSSRLTVVPP